MFHKTQKSRKFQGFWSFLESRIEPENTNLFNEGSGFGVLITGMGRSRCEVGFAILDYTSMQLRLTEFIDTSCHSTILSKVDFQNMTSYWLKWQINGWVRISNEGAIESVPI